METTSLKLSDILECHSTSFHPVVPFDPAKDRLLLFDFTEANRDLSPEQISDTDNFAQYINGQLKENGCRYGIGGYAEHRTLYARSRHFDTMEEPRRLHLGIDIWGPAGTPVMSPLDGLVHSFAFNNNDSDYGATIIISHSLENYSFHTLYGHLSLNSIKDLQEGMRISRGDVFTEFGMRFENGNWPPHLHFQVIIDIQDWNGDYPGVCRFSEKERWLENCPNPDILLQLLQYTGNV